MEEEASPEAPIRLSLNQQNLKSQVELSFVVLNLGELKLSDTSIAKAASDGERHSLVGKQIKVRVKTYAPAPPEEGEEEEEGSEQEHDEEENEQKEPSLHARFSRTSQDPPPLSSLTPGEEGATPGTTTAVGGEQEDLAEEEEQGNEEEGGDQQSTSDYVGDEEALKKENIHSALIEKECVVPEVLIVWEYVSKFIIEKMLEGFAVRVPGLGTFTHSIMPSDILKKPEHGKFSLRQTRKFPMFKICSYLKELYRLNEENHLYQCNVPTVPLNLSVVASNAKLSIGIVEGIIIETLQSFVTGIITNKNLEFPFPFMGKLFIKSRKVFMIFYQQFCEGLSFEFDYAPSFIFSVIPGNMTPLAYHRPAEHFHSVFHFCDVRSVEDKITARPRPYARAGLIREGNRYDDPCEFVKSLYTHSNLLYDCSCCNEDGTVKRATNKAKPENDIDDNEDNTPCGYSKNYDRIQKACCTQKGNFVFQKPDGSSFSPEPLFKTSKTGNPILDRLADDRCLLQQAIGCWMSKKVVETLGAETITKHHDREYFKKRFKNDNTPGVRVGGYGRKSYLVREPAPPSPVSVSPSASSSQKASINSASSRISSRRTSLASAEEEAFFLVEAEEEDEANGGADEPAISDNGSDVDSTKTVRSKSFRPSKTLPKAPDLQGEDQKEKRKSSGQQERERRRESGKSVENAEYEQDE